MVLFVDKYRPKTLNEFDIHKDISEKLIHLGQNKDIPNIIFNGLSGSGKTTLVNAFIKHYFNEKIKCETYSFKIDKKEVEYKKSDYHYEIIIKKKNYVLYHNIEVLVKHIIKNTCFPGFSGFWKSINPRFTVVWFAFVSKKHIYL